MSKFVYGTELTLTIEKIISNAQEHLYLFAPSIQLPSRLKEELRRKKMQDGLQIIIVFGKAEQDITKSISSDDLLFFKEFPNVVICYEEKLGVKYYANENTALLTSINLNEFAQTTHIEAGMVMNAKGMFKQLAGTLTNTITDTEKSSWDTASEFFADVLSKSRELYRKTPQYDKGFMNIGKKYSRSIVEVKVLDEFLASVAPAAAQAPPLILAEVPKPIVEPTPGPNLEEKKFFVTEYLNEEGLKHAEPKKEQEPLAPAKEAAPHKNIDEFQPGYCIRTGAAIFFNPRNPMSAKAMAEWQKESDPEFPENYCHFSGEPSYGQTSYNRPILQKNLKKAQEYMG